MARPVRIRTYKTKTQKKNALHAIHQKAMNLYMANILTLAEIQKIKDMVRKAERKL